MANAPTQWTEHDIKTFAATFSDPVELVRAVLRQVEANAAADAPMARRHAEALLQMSQTLPSHAPQLRAAALCLLNTSSPVACAVPDLREAAQTLETAIRFAQHALVPTSQEVTGWREVMYRLKAAANAPKVTGEPVAVVVPIDGHAANVPRNRMLSVLRELPQIGTQLYEIPPPAGGSQ